MVPKGTRIYVGQVLRKAAGYGTDINRITAVALVDGTWRAFSTGPSGVEDFFTELDSNQCSRHEWYAWEVVTEAVVKAVPIAAKVVEEKKDADWKFFSSVAPGNCACDIPKKDCSYHR